MLPILRGKTIDHERVFKAKFSRHVSPYIPCHRNNSLEILSIQGLVESSSTVPTALLSSFLPSLLDSVSPPSLASERGRAKGRVRESTEGKAAQILCYLKSPELKY